MSFLSYPEYKESGVEWIGNIPKHWKSVPLKYLAQLATGLTPPTHETDNYDESNQVYPWIRPEDLDENGAPVVASKYLSAKGWALTRRIAPFSSLICCIGTIGKVGFIDIEVSTNQQITSAAFYENARYYFYVTCAAKNELEVSSTGNVLRILNTERLGRIYCPKPTSSEANQIAAFLDRETAKIDALVAEQEKLIELLMEKRQAVISHAVTKGLDPNVPMKDSGVEWLGEVPEHWAVHKLGYKCLLQGGYAFASESFCSDGTPIVRMNNLSRGSLNLEEAVCIPADCSIDKVSLNNGDLIWGMSGSIGDTGSLGNFARVRQKDIPCQLNQRVGRFLPKDSDVSIDFLEWLIQSKYFYEQILLLVTGTAQFNVSSNQVESCIVSLPPQDEQYEIVLHLAAEVKRLEDLQAEAQRAIDLLKERRSVLISAAVTGKIDVRGLAEATH